MQWFVAPEVVRLSIEGGHWIEVKKRLTASEARKLAASAVKEVRTDGRVTPDFEAMGKAEALAYIVDWSLRDGADKPIAIDTDAKKQAALDNMSEEGFEVISKAVAAHAEAIAAEISASKKSRAGSPERVAT
jgi:hypothetical protein